MFERSELELIINRAKERGFETRVITNKPSPTMNVEQIQRFIQNFGGIQTFVFPTANPTGNMGLNVHTEFGDTSMSIMLNYGGQTAETVVVNYSDLVAVQFRGIKRSGEPACCSVLMSATEVDLGEALAWLDKLRPVSDMTSPLFRWLEIPDQKVFGHVVPA